MMGKKALIVTNLIGFVTFLWNDIELLKEFGYEVSFAANAEVITGENHQEELKKKNVKFHQIEFSSKNPFAKENLNAYRNIKNLIEKEKYDVIHCHTPIAGFITRMAARKFRKRGTIVIYTTHGFSFTHLSSKKEWIVYYYLEKFASLFTDLIITINNEDYENAKSMFCKNIKLINGVGVETNKYCIVDINVDEYKQKIGIPKDKIIVLSVGELSKRKNHQIIIKALGEIKNKNDYCYVICGREIAKSGITANLKKLAQTYNVNLILLGHRSDIPEIIHCSDIGAIPSIREGLGLAGIQSLSAGVPLVGTEVQGIKEYIIPGKTGFLCNPYDIQGYKEAILKLSNTDLRNNMKNKCIEIAKCFDVSISYNQMRRIYTSMLLEKENN